MCVVYVLCHAVSCYVRVLDVCCEVRVWRQLNYNCTTQPGLFNRRDSERQGFRHPCKHSHLARSMLHIVIIVEICAQLCESKVVVESELAIQPCCASLNDNDNGNDHKALTQSTDFP